MAVYTCKLILLFELFLKLQYAQIYPVKISIAPKAFVTVLK